MSEDRAHSQLLPENVALRAVVEGVETKIGDQFFASLVRQLAVSLGVQYAFVSDIAADRQSFRTRALWGHDALQDNVTVPLAGTPCEDVLNGKMSYHPEHLCALFPRDELLADWKAESYCGVPLLDRAGAVTGHLAVLDDRPMRDGPRGLSIMRIFAARAWAEIERVSGEEALRRSEAALRESEERLARILASAMDAIVTVDATRRVEIFNEAAETIFGCSAEQVLGEPLDRLLGPGLLEALEASMHRLPDGDQVQAYLYAPGGLGARDASGREFAVEGTISRVEVAGRALFTLILRDVESRRRAQAKLCEVQRHNRYLQEEVQSVHNFDKIIGQSCALADVLEKIELVAATDSSVLVLGETGTGKELIARAIHSRSPRRDRPLIKVSCAALPAGLVESELFGHERGSFTGAAGRRIGRFELAQGGTIFLDEVGDLAPETQVKLLTVLQGQEFERVGGSQTIHVDVRVIAATNRDLRKAVATGAFRDDLYYRLNVFPVVLPPLRERAEDIPLLVYHFVARFAAKIGRRIERVPPEVTQRLAAYPWPGNVRELEHVIERAVILSPGPELQVGAEVLQPPAAASAVPATGESAGAGAGNPGALRDTERRHIVAILKQTCWRINGPKGAARLLGIHPSTLRSRMERLGIRRSFEDLS